MSVLEESELADIERRHAAEKSRADAATRKLQFAECALWVREAMLNVAREAVREGCEVVAILHERASRGDEPPANEWESSVAKARWLEEAGLSDPSTPQNETEAAYKARLAAMAGLKMVRERRVPVPSPAPDPRDETIARLKEALAAAERERDESIAVINACAVATGDPKCLDAVASVATLARDLARMKGA